MTGNADQKNASPTVEAYLESIQDPIIKSMARKAVPQILDDGDDPAPPVNRLDDLEVAMRSHLFQLLLQLQEAESSIVVEKIGNYWKSCLNLSHHLVHFASVAKKTGMDAMDGKIDKIQNDPVTDPRYNDMGGTRRLPLVLLSDCLDGLPTLDAAKAFWVKFVEPALDDVLLGDLFWKEETVCQLPFLKVCNQFLKALEHSSSKQSFVEWKGRILCALAKGFSVADKSALKLWGSFHTTNTTDYESKDTFEDCSSMYSISKDEVEYNLYEAFWSLQADFANPNVIQIVSFIKRIKMVLAALESGAANNDPPKQQRGSLQERHQFLTSKYLTSSALLPSQIADADFRSNVVAQFLIVASHLSSESAPLKNALSVLLGRARKLLQQDNPELYRILWESILSNREDNWRQWKKQKCMASAFEPKRKRETNAGVTSQRKKLRARLLEGPLRSSGMENGDGDSNEAFNYLSRENLVEIYKGSTKQVPSLEQHLTSYVEALEPDSGIEEEYHPKNDSLFTWRAMRLYAKSNVALLRSCRKPADLERITREWYKSQGKEIAGEMPRLDEDHEEEEDGPDAAPDNRNEEEGPDKDGKPPPSEDSEGIDDGSNLDNDEEMEDTNEKSDYERDDDSHSEQGSVVDSAEKGDHVNPESVEESSRHSINKTGFTPKHGDDENAVRSDNYPLIEEESENADSITDVEKKAEDAFTKPPLSQESDAGNPASSDQPLVDNGQSTHASAKLDEKSVFLQTQRFTPRASSDTEVKLAQSREPSTSMQRRDQNQLHDIGSHGTGPQAGRSKSMSQPRGGRNDTDSKNSGLRDERPPWQNARNFDGKASDATTRGRNDGPSRGIGRPDDDFRDGGGRGRQGGNRGERFQGDRGEGTVREALRGERERGGDGKDDHRVGERDRGNRTSREDHRGGERDRGGGARGGRGGAGNRGTGGGRDDHRAGAREDQRGESGSGNRNFRGGKQGRSRG